MSRISANIVWVLFLLSGALYAQDADNLSNVEMTSDTLVTEYSDTLKTPQQEEKEELVDPWIDSIVLNSRRVNGDSLLRWQIWPDWGHFYAYREDVISFRQASTGRIDAYHIKGYLPMEQRYSMEGITLNNPVTGYTNFNLIPHRKIDGVYERYEGSLRSEISLRDYYINKPISYLNYDESKFRYRNLEFMVSQNFTDRTNLELSYWDRRDGDYYNNDEIQGSQIYARFYHHLNQKMRIRAIVLRNEFNNGEPFGYVVGDPLNFSFSRFATTPNFSGGSSDFKRLDVVTGLYIRGSGSEKEKGGVELSLSRNEKSVRGPGDQIRQDLLGFGLRSFWKIDLDRLKVDLSTRLNRQSARDSMAISIDNWIQVTGGANARFRLLKGISLTGSGEISYRDDDYSGYEATAGIELQPASWLSWKVKASVFSRVPTIQQLYWRSLTYQGNSDLDNQNGVSVFSSLDLNEEGKLSVGINGRIRLMDNPVLLRSDSTFGNAPSMFHGMATAYARFQNHRWEFETSATYQLAEYDNITDPAYRLDRMDDILWLRNDAFVKGYLFDRATFIKFGLRSVLSPFLYGSRTFNTGLEYWQAASTYQELPSWFRVDAELSARLRGMMIVLRWENALDGLGQVGYFESAGYPMPPRRLIIGIRAQFRN
ncbi:putative porin [Balneola sp. MJW-20]|uniref:putative porin n=1 Tax=Gracilimonas aurantiaca TaxID=3234185 RepID=UPI0034655293